MDFVRFNAPDSPGVNQWASAINNEAAIAEIPPCLLAAVVSRETGGQNILQHGMAPGPGCGVGLTQITSGVDWSDIHDPRLHGYHLMDPGQNLYVAAAYYLAPLVKDANRLSQTDIVSYKKFGGGQMAYYVFAGYNAGWGAVQEAIARGIDPDAYTTNHYASDTFRRYMDFVRASHAAARPK